MPGVYTAVRKDRGMSSFRRLTSRTDNRSQPRRHDARSTLYLQPPCPQNLFACRIPCVAPSSVVDAGRCIYQGTPFQSVALAYSTDLHASEHVPSCLFFGFMFTDCSFRDAAAYPHDLTLNEI